MGSNVEITMLCDVHPFKTSWTVQVKVLHVWKSFTALTGSSLEMVLADENGWKIHARCKQSLMQNNDMRDLCVGKWKVISNFSLSCASGLYRPTNHFYKMDFLSQTTVTDSNIQCDDMFLDLHDFSSIKNASNDTCFLIDVIGEVLDFSGLGIIHGPKNLYKGYPEDQTGETRFSLPDSVSATLVKSAASRLLSVYSDEFETEEELPAEIVAIVGKNYGFGVSLNEINEASGVHGITAMKVWNIYDITWKYFKTLHQQASYSSKKQCTGLVVIEKDARDEHNDDSSG